VGEREIRERETHRCRVGVVDGVVALCTLREDLLRLHKLLTCAAATASQAKPSQIDASKE